MGLAETPTKARRGRIDRSCEAHSLPPTILSRNATDEGATRCAWCAGAGWGIRSWAA